MPEFPVYTSQQSLSTESVGAPIPQGAGYGARVLQSIGSEVEKIADTWQKAHVTNQYTTAKNQIQGEVNQLLADADNELDHNKKKEYIDRIKKIADGPHEIDDRNVKNHFDSDKALQMSEALIRVDGMFKQKMIANQRGEILKDSKNSKNDYISGYSDTHRGETKRKFIDRLDTYKASGYITEQEYQSELEDAKQWDYDRALQDIGYNPQGTAENIDSYDVDPRQKNELINIATSSARRNDRIRAIASLEMFDQNESEMAVTVFEDKTTPIAVKIKDINEQELRGQISEDFATKARRYLTSVENLESVSTDGEYAQIVRLIYDTNERVSDFANLSTHEQYLKRVGEIRNRIVDTPDLSNDDRSSLLKVLTNTTAKKQSESSVELGRLPKYREANNYFDERIPLFRDEALRRYVVMTMDKPGLDPQESLRIMQNIETSIVYAKRKDLLETIDFVREKTGPAADVRIEVGDKGEPIVVLYKDGKRFKVAAPGPAPKTPAAPAESPAEEPEAEPEPMTFPERKQRKRSERR